MSRHKKPFHKNISAALYSIGGFSGWDLGKAIHVQNERDMPIANRTMLRLLAISHVPPDEATRLAEPLSGVAYDYREDKTTVALCVRVIAALKIQGRVLEYIQPTIAFREDIAKQHRRVVQLLRDSLRQAQKRHLSAEEFILIDINKSGKVGETNTLAELFECLTFLQNRPAELAFLHQFKVMVEKTIRKPRPGSKKSAAKK